MGGARCRGLLWKEGLIIFTTSIGGSNKQQVLQVIRRFSPIYKAEIARRVGISIPAVIKIVAGLMEKGLVCETEKGVSTGGKPPQLLTFVPDSRLIVGVDIGTTNVLTILMDCSAKILRYRKVPTARGRDFSQVLAQVYKSVDAMVEGVEPDRLLGIGVAVPGLIDPETDLLRFSPDFGWENVEIVPGLASRYHKPIVMDNLTRAMAMGEKWFGLAEDAHDFVCVCLGHGIGGALVVQDELYRGQTGSAGEIGHIILDPNGPLCDCGKHGCLEAMASGNAIVKRARALLDAGRTSALPQFLEGPDRVLTAKSVFDAAKAGDALANELVNEAIENIGIGIASVINLLDPELVILEGGISRAGEILTSRLSSALARRQMRYAGQRTRVLTSQLGELSAAVGAASYLLKSFIDAGGENPRL